MPAKSVPGNYFAADTLAGLAGKIGVDAKALVQTAHRFSEFARAGIDTDFNRGASIWDRNRGGDPANKPNPTLGSIDQPPFYAMPFKASYLGTKGGARTNQRAEVLNQDGAPIPGLYAAGNVMANPFGSKGVGAGTTLGPCLTWGYIAALNAMGTPS
jgi:3-oxosteroid 1-dehydrogenase